MPDPLMAGQAAPRAAVIGSRLHTECHAVAGEGDPFAEAAVYRVQVGRVGWIGSHMEAGIAAQHVRAAGANHQARAPDHDVGLPYAAELRERLRYVSVDLEPQVLAEEAPDATTGTELVGELDRALQPRVAAVLADVVRPATLRAEG